MKVFLGSSTSATFGQANAPAKHPEMGPPPVASDPAPGVVKPSSTNFPNVQYPRIEADGRVSFRFVAPSAQKVQVSIVNQPFDMVKGEDGAWTYTTAKPQAPGTNGNHGGAACIRLLRCCFATDE